MSESQHPDYLVVRVGTHGLGVFTSKAIKKGETIFVMNGNIIRQPTRTSVQIGAHRHIEDSLSCFLNHKCDATAIVVREKQSVVAIKDLNEGDEITFDYTNNEDTMAEPFNCHCCSERIQGKSTNTEAKKHKELISEEHE